MKLRDYELVFAVVGLIGVLLISSPVISTVVHLPSGEHFSELYLLGPNHMAENYPFNIVADQNYSIYVGVNNHMGASAYYVLYIKLRNQTDSSPNATMGTPSSLTPLYEYGFFLQDGQNWERLLTFSVLNASLSGNQTVINAITINNVLLALDKPALWNTNSTIFSYQLFFELWLFDTQSDMLFFNDRFVGLQLNLTTTV